MTDYIKPHSARPVIPWRAFFMTLALVAGCVQTTETANAAEEETWKCCTGPLPFACLMPPSPGLSSSGLEPVDLTATAYHNKIIRSSGQDSHVVKGVVKMGSIVAKTQFHIEGLDRRWDWGWSDKLEGHQYSFVISPDNTGAYFHFRDEKATKPRAQFTCRRSSGSSPSQLPTIKGTLERTIERTQP